LDAGPLWNDAHSLWIRFCGVSDELKTLRDRWDFLSELPYSPLPSVEDLFERLISFTCTIETKFRILGFSRFQLEKKSIFMQAVSLMKLEEIVKLLSELRAMFSELQEYLGTLKMTFFQRTNSLEIPQLVGLPRSPQKTMGDEALYLAADKVTRCYLGCLRWSHDLQWDGITSILYPDEMGFLGGALRTKPYVKTFHISLAEDGKYFPGAFLFLAHEAAHVPLRKVADGEVKQSGWVFLTQMDFSALLLAKMEIAKVILDGSVCGNCPNYQFIGSIVPSRREVFQNCIADIVSIEIGGVCTLYALVDLVPSLDTFFRVSFVGGYYANQRAISEEVAIEEKSLYDSLVLKRQRDCNRGNPRLCLDFIVELGKTAGHSFRDNDLHMIKDDLSSLFAKPDADNQNLANVWEDQLRARLKICKEFYDLPCSESLCSLTGGEILPHLVKERFIRGYDNELAECLLRGNCPPPDTDPRLVLHVFYKTFRIKGPPGFSSTIHTLATSELPAYARQLNVDLH
jgi:hypothetical protein